MLDPARAGEMLLQFDLADGDGAQTALGRGLEGDGAGRGGALVDGEDERVHVPMLERMAAVFKRRSAFRRRLELTRLWPGPEGSSRRPRRKDAKGSDLRP